MIFIANLPVFLGASLHKNNYKTINIIIQHNNNPKYIGCFSGQVCFHSAMENLRNLKGVIFMEYKIKFFSF